MAFKLKSISLEDDKSNIEYDLKSNNKYIINGDKVIFRYWFKKNSKEILVFENCFGKYEVELNQIETIEVVKNN